MLSVELGTRLGELELRVRLEVDAGRCLALVGPSGAGKSSLLRAIGGLLRPREGWIECGGETWLDSAAGTDLPPEHRRCGFVFQDYALFAHMPAWRNVAFGLGHLPRRARRDAALALLDRFGIGARAEAHPASLSGGERQRVALARALGARPRALLLDEPLAALDATTRGEATHQLQQLTAAVAVPTLLVTHDFAEATTLAEEIAVLEHGRVVQRGGPKELAAQPASPFVADLIGAVVLTGTVVRAGRLDRTEVLLAGGGTVTVATAVTPGPVAVAVHPSEIALEPSGAAPLGSSRNRLHATVSSTTPIGSRLRVSLDAGQPLVAEITPVTGGEPELRPGTPVIAEWDVSDTRFVPLGT